MGVGTRGPGRFRKIKKVVRERDERAERGPQR